MNLFAFYAACTALLLFVLGVLTVPLLRRGGQRHVAPDLETAQVAVHRDQLREIERERAAGTLTETQFAAARGQIEARLGEELATMPRPPQAVPGRLADLRTGWRNPMWLVAAATAAVVIAGAWSLYAQLGTPQAIVNEAGQTASATAARAAKTTTTDGAPLPSMEVLAQRLALKMRTQTPDDGEGWALLARSYVEIKQYREAADAFAQATKRIPNDATLLSDYADALGMAKGKTLRGEPAALVQRALKADPNHPKALALAASAAFDDKQYRDAIAYWERLRAMLAPTSDDARGIEANIAEARALLDGRSAPLAAPVDVSAGTVPVTTPAAPSGSAISGTVRVAPELTAKVASGDTLFVYAKAVTGPQMPLAIVRANTAGFPFAFRLDESQAMLPELRLSRVSEVALTARVSHRGTATPQAGDLQGTVQPVKVGSSGVEVVIDQVVH